MTQSTNDTANPSPVVVGFDGTPIAGCAGVRAPIFCDADGLCTSGTRSLRREALDELARDGFVTLLAEPMQADRVRSDGDGDGVVLYRDPSFAMPALPATPEATAAVQWHPLGAFLVAYLPREVARDVMESLAKAQFRLGVVALAAHDWAEVERCARRGLAVVPGLRTSHLATKLYALLYAARERRGADTASIRWEIAQRLEERLAIGAVVLGTYSPGPRGPGGSQSTTVSTTMSTTKQ